MFLLHIQGPGPACVTMLPVDNNALQEARRATTRLQDMIRYRWDRPNETYIMCLLLGDLQRLAEGQVVTTNYTRYPAVHNDVAILNTFLWQNQGSPGEAAIRLFLRAAIRTINEDLNHQ